MRFQVAAAGLCVAAASWAGCRRPVAPSGDAGSMDRDADPAVAPTTEADAAAPRAVGTGESESAPVAGAAALAPPRSAATGPQPWRGPGALSGFEQFYRQPPASVAAAAPEPGTLTGAPPIGPAAPEADDLLQAVARTGFARLPGGSDLRLRTCGEAYAALREVAATPYLPVDVPLHLTRLLLDGLLERIEREAFPPLLVDWIEALRARAAAAIERGGPIGEAAAENLTQLEVARMLLDPGFEPSEAVADRVRAELDRWVRSAPSPGAGPVRDPEVGRLRRTLTYLADPLPVRAAVDPVPAGRVSLEVARRNAVRVALYQTWMRETPVAGATALHLWTRIQRSAAFLHGLADDPDVVEAMAACELAFGGSWREDDLDDAAKLDVLRFHLAAARVPALYEGTTPKDPSAALGLARELPGAEADRVAGAAYRLMGRLEPPDAVLRDRLLATVPPCDAERTPAPLLPGGPELLALLGGPVPPTPAGACPIPAAAWTSVRALLPARGDPGWHSSVHWAWLEILDGLLAPPSGRGAAVEAWAARRRDAALVAWAALHRRAGFVSAARSPTDPFPAPPASADGRVEGDPPTFARLEALVRAARAGLADLRLVEADGEVAGILDAWADRLALLSEGAIAAVEGRPPGEAAARAAGAFAEEAEALLRRLTRLDRSGSVTEIDVRIPFEVETASRAGRVRREGAGPIGLLVVRVPDAAGGFTAAVGPAARPINER